MLQATAGDSKGKSGGHGPTTQPDRLKTMDGSMNKKGGLWSGRLPNAR